MMSASVLHVFGFLLKNHDPSLKSVECFRNVHGNHWGNKGKHSKLQLLSEVKPGSSNAVCLFFETCLDMIHEVPSVHKKTLLSVFVLGS